jgi:phosphoribosylformylglycinamidine cyclo-ligase
LVSAENDNGAPEESAATIGSLLLSPTRTYAPFIKALLDGHFDEVHGLVHCSGGGQTKCLKYLHDNFRIVKDHLFEPPLIFRLIQESSKADDREMYQVFNMGHRLEIFTREESAQDMIKLARSFNIQAQVIGRVETSHKRELIISGRNQEIGY